MPKVIHPSDIDALIPENSQVFIQGGVGEPQTIIESLSSSETPPKNVDYFGVSIPGINNFSPHKFHSGARFHTFFIHKGISPGTNYELLFHPLHYRDIFRYLEQCGAFDVTFIQVSAPDSHGRCSFGPSVDFVPAIINQSRCVIAEINSQLPPALNGPSIAHDNIDFFINTNRPLPTSNNQISNDTEATIAKHVAALIDDSSCIQIGIGKLPNSILHQLQHHRRLGIHSGLISDATKDLIELGVITGESKTIDRHKHVTGLALGSNSFYRWVAGHPNIIFRAVNHTHDHKILASIDQFVSINSALEIDLQGQVNAERVRGRAVSASGGLVDFVRGARGSRGGKSILALPASAIGGSQSRIVTKLSNTAIITLCRTDIDHVVTEYGSASLFALDTEQRARALVDIAKPELRSELWNDWENAQS